MTPVREWARINVRQKAAHRSVIRRGIHHVDRLRDAGNERLRGTRQTACQLSVDRVKLTRDQRAVQQKAGPAERGDSAKIASGQARHLLWGRTQ
jgi:hypothetical protein